MYCKVYVNSETNELLNKRGEYFYARIISKNLVSPINFVPKNIDKYFEFSKVKLQHNNYVVLERICNPIKIKDKRYVM